MFHFALLLLTYSSVTDKYGVSYIDDTYSKLILASNTLKNYTIPCTVKTIAGGTAPGQESYSAFYPCRAVLEELYFEEGSLLTTIESYGLSGLIKLTKLDMGPCMNLKILTDAALKSCTSIKELILPPNLIMVKRAALYLLSSVTNLNFPSSFQSVGGWTEYGDAIGDCAKLTTVTWGENPSIQTLGGVSFRNCGLTSIHIPLSLTTISAQAFHSCPITSITVEQGHSIFATDGRFIFDTTMSTIQLYPTQSSDPYTIDDSITAIGSGAFVGTRAETVYLNPNLVSIGSSAFAYSYIKNITLLPSITSINQRAFYVCYSLEKVIFNASIKTIPVEMFARCTQLKEIIVPPSTTSILSGAFSGCTVISHIYIPSSVTSISFGVFSNINKSCQIEFANDSQIKYESGYLYNNNFTAVIAYIGDESSFECIIKSGVETISASTFYGLGVTSVSFEEPCVVKHINEKAFSTSTITSISIPGTVKTISIESFALCTKLKTITINEGVVLIDDSAFKGCAAVSIIIPSTVTNISSSAFADSHSLSVVAFGGSTQSIMEIGNNAFASTAITSFTVVKSIRNIGSEVFSDSDLNSLVFDDNIELIEISRSAFINCLKLQNIDFGGVRIIGQSSFENCKLLPTFVIGSKVEIIRINAFLNCKNLHNFSIPKFSVLNSIEQAAFAGCDNLLNISIEGNGEPDDRFKAEDGVLYNFDISEIVLYLPANSRTLFDVPLTIQQIRMFSFQGADNLIQITLPINLQSIGYGAFTGCTNLASINIPSNISFIGSMAFSGCSSLKCSSIIYDKENSELKNKLIEASASLISLTPCATGAFTIKTDDSEKHSFYIFSSIIANDYDIGLGEEELYNGPASTAQCLNK